jgi:hypothetical protein
MSSRPTLDRLLASDGAAVGCNETFEVLDRNADAEVAGENASRRYPGVACVCGPVRLSRGSRRHAGGSWRGAIARLARLLPPTPLEPERPSCRRSDGSPW